MNYLGIDYGLAKIGLAKASEELRIATPLVVIFNGHNVLEELETILATEQITQIIVVYPLTMAGEVGAQAKEVDEFIERIKVLSIPILKQDERLSSAAAVSRGPDDSSAAALILQTYLDSHVRNNQ